MATTDLHMTAPDPVPAKKGRGKKVLKDKKPSTNEANILAGELSEVTQSPAPVLESNPSKENLETMSHPRSEKKKSKAKSKGKQTDLSSNFEKELQEMQEMLEKMKIEKEKTEEMLKEKDEILKQKDEEIETRDKEQQKLQTELKKLQKMKEFKPTMDKELEKKDKKKKECPERKRPASAYVLWSKDQWNEIKKNNTETDFKEVSNIMGAKWKSLTEEEKKPYEEKYKAEREVYLQIMSKEKREIEAMKLLEEDHKQKTAMELLDEYLQFKQEATDKHNKKTKKEKDPSKPKRPMCAFFLYSNERRAALLADGKTLLEASKVIGQEWKSMTEEQKKPYEEVVKEKMGKYQEEMEIYKQKKEEETSILKKEEQEIMKIQKVEALQMLKKKEKNDNAIKKAKDMKKKQKVEKIVDPNKPKKPATSYLLFSKEERKNILQEHPDINTSTINAVISLKWKELNENEKGKWNEKAAKSMEAYKKELEEYNKAGGGATKEEGKSQS